MARLRTTPSGVGTFTLEELRGVFARHLRAENKSPRTLETYDESVQVLATFLQMQHASGWADEVEPADIEDLMVHLLERCTPATASNRFRGLRVFFKWCAVEGYVKEDPTARLKEPRVPDPEIRVPTSEEIGAILKACHGNAFEDRRDEAIIRLFADTGMRRAELANLTVADVDLDQQVARVMGKGARPRPCPFGDKTARALDRYKVMRVRHLVAALPAFWLSRNGVMSYWGIESAVQRRAKAAGVEHIHLHAFRHYFAHNWLVEGGQENDLMRITGWKSRQMVGRYAATTADQRAKEQHKRFSPGNRL